MSSCPIYEELIGAYLQDDELGTATRAHIESCPACSEALDELGTTIDVLRDRYTIRPELADAIILRLADDRHGAEIRFLTWWRRNDVGLAVFLLSAVTVFFALVLADVPMAGGPALMAAYAGAVGLLAAALEPALISERQDPQGGDSGS